MAFALHRSPTSTSKQVGFISPEAIQVLAKLPGMQSTNTSWLHSACLLEDDSNEYDDICEYVRNGQEHKYGMEVVNIVKLFRAGEKEFENDPNTKGRFRMILWHGTKKAVMAKILQDGFKLPSSNNQMFGPGIYFADRLSKSIGYCDQKHNPTVGSTAFVLLCDVLLGKMYNSKNAKNTNTAPPCPGALKFDSVMCTGKLVPDRDYNKKIAGSVIPCGPTIDNTKFPSYNVIYNEYIVYDVSKVRIRYLVEVEFHSSPI